MLAKIEPGHFEWWLANKAVSIEHLGPAFIHDFMPTVSDATLMHETDRDTVIAHIRKEYVNHESQQALLCGT